MTWEPDQRSSYHQRAGYSRRPERSRIATHRNITPREYQDSQTVLSQNTYPTTALPRGRGGGVRGGRSRRFMPSQGRRGGSGRGTYYLTLHNNGGPLPPVQITSTSTSYGHQRQHNQSSSSTSPVPALSHSNTATTSPELPSPSIGINQNTMDAATISVNSAGGSGEFPTIIQRARPYLTEEQIEDLKPDDPGWEARDVSMRLNACNWILSIGALLQFPIRTMATAMILFHRFKLFHPKWEHPYSDCAAAALFVACKIEDTLKKSREILAAGHSIKHGATSAESINPDNPLLDEPARRTLILERVILESSSFDFRNRHSQPFLIKFCRKLGLDKEVSRLGWDICIDCYRTLSPLKATPHVQALAAISLAQKLLGRKEIPIEYDKFEAKRADVLDVMKDLLDLYTHHRSYTIVGEKYSAETYITIRIALNEVSAQEASSSRINGSHHSNGKGKGKGVSALAPGITGLSEKDKLAIGESVRFMLDGERERKERRGSVMDTREG